MDALIAIFLRAVDACPTTAVRPPLVIEATPGWGRFDGAVHVKNPLLRMEPVRRITNRLNENTDMEFPPDSSLYVHARCV